MNKDIYPLNQRRPTIQENEQSRALANALSYMSTRTEPTCYDAIEDKENNPLLINASDAIVSPCAKEPSSSTVLSASLYPQNVDNVQSMYQSQCFFNRLKETDMQEDLAQKKYFQVV